MASSGIYIGLGQYARTADELRGIDKDTIAQLLSSEAHDGNPDHVGVLLDAGADVNGTGSHTTCLMMACVGGHDPCVHLLLEAGAELDHANDCGRTALMYACINGNEACARTLLDAGADPTAVDKGGRDAAQFAERYANHFIHTEKQRQGCLRITQLLQQRRQPVPWSPKNHNEFPKCRRQLVARLSWRLLRDGLWVAKRSRRVPEGGSIDNRQIVRDEWLAYVERYVCERVPPMSRVVEG